MAEKFRYRDSKTGKLVSEATFNRSKAHGGTRYVKESTEKAITSLDQWDGWDDFFDYYDEADASADYF